MTAKNINISATVGLYVEINTAIGQATIKTLSDKLGRRALVGFLNYKDKNIVKAFHYFLPIISPENRPSTQKNYCKNFTDG